MEEMFAGGAAEKAEHHFFTYTLRQTLAEHKGDYENLIKLIDIFTHVTFWRGRLSKKMKGNNKFG